MTEVIVQVQHGLLQGSLAITSSGLPYSSFQGIPYAKPPVGPLRFKDPQSLDPWTGVLNATNEGSPCAQSDVFVQKKDYLGEESCLYLNVYTPHELNKSSEITILLPVMFWIHGGGFFSGSGSADLFGPDYLLEKNVVVVTINYRLGVLGFLNMGTPEVPGNAGLKDIVTALRWVKHNIMSFGGDPNNVTIFGESAGGAAVQFLMISKMAQGLFHKAISQSGSCLSQWAFNTKNSIQSNKAASLAALLGYNTDDSETILEVLKSAPVEVLVKLAQKTQTDEESKKDSFFPFSPSIENLYPGKEAFLTEDPLELWKSGKFSQVPYISGYNSGEGILWAINLKNNSQYLKTFDENFQYFVPLDLNNPLNSTSSLEIAKKIREFYLGDKNLDIENIQTYFDIVTDYTFLQKIVLSTKTFKKLSSSNVYFYKFSFDGDLNFFKKHHHLNYNGACHEDELGYLFKPRMMNLKTEEGSSSKKLLKQMATMWTNFAKTGNPTPSTTELLPTIWNPVSEENINYLEISENLQMKLNPESKRMKFWEEIYDNYKV